MKVLAIIVSYNFERWITNCLDSLRQSEHPADVVVIDNCSQDHTVQLIEQHYPEVQLIKSNENLGFGKANNLGMQIAINKNYDFVFLLNQDAWIDRQTIGTLATLSRHYPQYGILSPVHLTGKGDAPDPGFAIYSGAASLERLPQTDLAEVPFINAAFWMIPVPVLKTIGGFSPLFYHYGEDVDFANRLHYHGFKIGYAPAVFGNHDREQRIVTKPMEYRAKSVYLLTAYANINHSFRHAFVKAIGGGCEQVVKSLAKGQWKDATVYVRTTLHLLGKSNHIRLVRNLCREQGSHFIIK